MNEPVIYTERLTLFPLSDGAMREMIDRETDPDLRQAYREMLDGCLSHPGERAFSAVWTMRLTGSGEAVGDLCFKGLGPDGCVEIGYGTYPGYEGRGYMTEAVTALTRWALAQPGVSRAEAETDPGNAASQRVLAKAGYVPTGKCGEEGPRFVYAGPRG